MRIWIVDLISHYLELRIVRFDPLQKPLHARAVGAAVFVEEHELRSKAGAGQADDDDAGDDDLADDDVADDDAVDDDAASDDDASADDDAALDDDSVVDDDSGEEGLPADDDDDGCCGS